MIRSQTVRGAIPIAQSLCTAGIALSAVPNTPLSELFRHSVPSFQYEISSDEELLNQFPELVSGVTSGNGDDVGQHTLELNGLVDDLSSLVSGHISYAKNTVKPSVLHFAEALSKYLQDNSVKDPASVFEIKVINLPEILLDESFLDVVKAYKDKSVLTPDKFLAAETKSPDEIKALLVTGSARTDKLIAEWVVSLPDSFINDLWSSFFSSSANAGSSNYQMIESYSSIETVNYALGIFLISRKLYNEVTSTKDMSLSAYKDILIQYQEYSGSLISACLTRIATSIKTKQLILEINSVQKYAKVNGIIYKEWLEAGGRPEIILGLVSQGKTITGQSAIDEEAVAAEQAWNSYCLYFKTTEANKSFDYFKDQVMHLFLSSYSEQDDSEKEYLLKFPNTIQKSKELLEAQLLTFRTADMKDPYQVALVAIAKCRFGYTSAFKILSDINEAGKINPNVDVREAALLAAINYVSAYVVNQMSFK